MSKKKFKSGLESLFGEPAVAGMSPYLSEKEKTNVKGNDTKEKSVPLLKSLKRSSSKNFTADLESLFTESTDNEQSILSKSAEKNNLRLTKKQPDKPVIGLDALIRRTAQEAFDAKKVANPLKKRLTIIMERQKLEELKKVAREKKAYLRDLIDDLISDYLQQVKEGKIN